MVKGTAIIFGIGVFCVLGTITKVFPVEWFIIVGIFILWFITFYFKKHNENKGRDKPSPIYLADPPL